MFYLADAATHRKQGDVDSGPAFSDNPYMAKPNKEQIRAFYRTRVVAIQASFEGYATVQREKLTAEDCQLSPKKRASLLKKLEKDEKSMEKAFRRALKSIDKT